MKGGSPLCGLRRSKKAVFFANPAPFRKEDPIIIMAKNTLGRGLDSLFLENTAETGDRITMIRLSDIEPNPDQPRRSFDPESLAQLADSIAVHGVVSPIAVRESGGDSGFYQIIAGERRWRAAKMAGLSEIPAMILEADDAKAAQLALIENLQREDLNAVEEAQAYRSLLEEYGMTQEDAARQIGKSRSAISNALRLLDLPENILSLLASDRISAGHARALLSVSDPEAQASLASMICKKGLSVRETELWVRRLKEQQSPPSESETASPMRQSYFRELEARAASRLGRRFKITHTGSRRKIELSFTDDEDLECLLRQLCGDDIFTESPSDSF